MPCQYYTPQEQAERTANYYRTELNRLTNENDMLREALLAAIEGEEIDPEFLKEVRKNQTKHRKEDLERLKNNFIEERDAERLGMVILADPRYPLKPQLGFDPDDF